MKLLEYFKQNGPESRKAMAEALGLHIQQIQNFAYEYRKPSIPQALRISALTGGQVSLETLRDDIDWAQMRADINRAA